MFLALPLRSGAGTPACFDGSPAFPVPELVNGERIWPPSGLRPVKPGQQLAGERDSTRYVGLPNQLPGSPGLELFTDLDIVGNYIYTAYNSGLQVWDISGTFAAEPKLIASRNGWSAGVFLKFEKRPTEVYFLIFGIDAIDPPSPGEDVLIALAGHSPVGLSIWDATVKTNPRILYQDWNRWGEDVATAHINGRTYAFFAASTGGGRGLHVYDMKSARSLQSPCLEDSSAAIKCPNVYKGKMGNFPAVRYVSHLERNNRHFVAVSEGGVSGIGVAIHEIVDPSKAQSSEVFSGLESSSQGVGLFAHGGRAYLALKGSTDIRIFDVTTCLDSGNCTALNQSPVWSMTVGTAGGLVSVSQAGAPYLYFGSGATCLQGTKKEFLFNVGGLGSQNPAIEEATAFPAGAPPGKDGKFQDDQTGRDVDYWGYYLDRNTTGFSYVIPRAAKAHLASNGTVYVYRTAFSLFDVHEFSIQDPQPVIPGIEVSPAGGSYPQGQKLTFRPSGTIVGREPFTYQWTVRDKREVAIPNLPNTTGAEFRLNTCSLPLTANVVFHDDFESGSLSRWSATSRATARAAAGGVEFTVELKVSATVDKKTYSAKDSVPIAVFPPADPAFDSPPVTASSLGEARYELTAHTNGSETQVRWQIADANGTASCNFGNGSVRCAVFDWGVKGTQLTHQWAAPNVAGPHKVRVAIRRLECDGTLKTAAPQQIDVQVAITEPSTPEVTLFRVLEGGLAHCDCPGFGLPCSCNSGRAVSFEVTTDSPATGLEFTWGDGKVETVSPSTSNVYTHSFASGTYSPTVRAVSGSHFSQARGLPESSLEIQ